MKSYPMKFETYSLSEMMKPYLLRVVFIGLILFFINKTFAQSHGRVSDKELKAQAVKWMATQKPLGFQENKGQMADEKGKLVPNVLFKIEVPSLNIWLTTSGLTYQFWKREKCEDEEPISGIEEMEKYEEKERELQQGSKFEWVRVDMLLKGASIKKSNILPENEITIGRHDYYLGHCPDGVIDVRTYGRLVIKEIYPGIDWVLYTALKGGLKYDFVVHPNASPDQIKLIYQGIGKLKMNDNRIRFENEYGEITEGDLLCYQKNESNTISSHYTFKETKNRIQNGFSYEIGIEIPYFDQSKLLVIDPQLVWATYYGGEGGEKALDIATDGNNNIFVGGYTSSLAFPTQSFGAAYYQGANNGGSADLFILKFTGSGILLWAIYYGGSNIEFWNNDITADSAGNLFFVGSTGSLDLPTMAMTGAYNDPTANGGGWDGFILKFNSNGIRQWATYLGGNSWDMITSVKEYQGNLFVSGVSSSPNFPTFNPGAPAYYDGSWAGPAGDMDVVILKFNILGALTWSTFYGNAGLEDWNSINIDGLGNIYVVGEMEVSSFPVFNKPGAYNQNVTSTASEGYIIEFASNLSLQWATCLGGSGGDFPCFFNGISFDSNNNLYVAGYTTGNFPIVNLPGAYNQSTGNSEGFITKFNVAGAMVWSTYLGGNGLDRIYSSVIDACDNLYVCGIATPNFPTINLLCNSYFDNSLSGSSDGFFTQFNSLGAMVWSTYYGGNGDEDFQDICIDKNYNLLVAGNTTSANFPTQSWGSAFVDNSIGGGGDAVVLKFIPPPPFTTAQSQVNPSGCSACNGTATVTITSACGVPPYSYLWNTGATTSNITGLCAGGYSVVVSDGNCQKQRDTLYYTLTGGSGGITVGVTGANANCNSNGSATVTAGGGISPYTYLWSNGTASISATGLGAGIYTVTVTDNSGCLKAQTVQITIGGGLSATTSFQAVKCNGTSDGTATVTVAGGTIPYTYLWNNGQGAQTATGLSAGTYLLTITDIAGCKITKSISVTEPPPVLYVTTSKQSTCGLSNGSATVTASNGTPSYTYNWSTGSTVQTISGLSAGLYTVTITDANGCKAIPQINITAIPLVSIALTTTNGTCGNGGSANASVTGGAMPYTYAWSASGGQTTSSASALSAGSYTVSVTDVNSCTATKTFTITDTPSLASATFTQSPAGTVCVGATINFTNTGTIGTYNWVISTITPANVSGQTADFSYVFLTTGTYTVSHTVTTSGCSKTVTSTVNVINCTASPTVTATGTSVCPGTCATVTSSGTGGTAPYTFTWSNGSTSQNINPCPVSTTTYTVTIKDAGGNTSASTAAVTVNPAVTAATTVTDINCNGGTGSAAVVGGGGTSPYIYTWNIGQTTSTVTGLITGNYVVTITDSKGCTSISTAIITSPPPLIGQFSKGTSICGGCGCKEWIMVNAVGGSGPYNFTWPDGNISRYKNHLCPGVYTVNIADKNGCNVNVSLTAP